MRRRAEVFRDPVVFCCVSALNLNREALTFLSSLCGEDGREKEATTQRLEQQACPRISRKEEVPPTPPQKAAIFCHSLKFGQKEH